MKLLRRIAFAIAIAGCCAAVADDSRPAAQFPLYSFADLYRLTVHATPDALVFAPAASTPQVRVAMTESFAVAEPRFTVTQVPSTQGWMLLLAGLAAASWVAHRRLTSAY
jgi:hypothetical protein